jgi:hypothetical protein
MTTMCSYLNICLCHVMFSCRSSFGALIQVVVLCSKLCTQLTLLTEKRGPEIDV